METMRCKKHPDFDPYNRFSNFNKECNICCGLHYGAKPIGHFGGEFTASAYDIKNAKTKIGPLNLEQFGHIRFSLGWDFHFEDAPSWHVDGKTMTIYIDERLDNKRLREFKKMKCKISTREWTESKI